MESTCINDMLYGKIFSFETVMVTIGELEKEINSFWCDWSEE